MTSKSNAKDQAKSKGKTQSSGKDYCSMSFEKISKIGGLNKTQASVLVSQVIDGFDDITERSKNLYKLVAAFDFGNGHTALGYDSFHACMKEKLQRSSLETLYRIRKHIQVACEYFPGHDVFDISQSAAYAIHRIGEPKLQKTVVKACLKKTGGDLGEITGPMVRDEKREIERKIKEKEAEKERNANYEEQNSCIEKVDADASKPSAKEKDEKKPGKAYTHVQERDDDQECDSEDDAKDIEEDSEEMDNEALAEFQKNARKIAKAIYNQLDVTTKKEAETLLKMVFRDLCKIIKENG
jgi:hypothetical protein